MIAVASVETEVFPASPFEATFTTGAGEEETVQLGYLPSTNYFPPSVKDWPIVPMNPDVVDNDGCEPYPDDTPRLGDVIPLVRRGTCTFEIKARNLEALGAKYILFYNNDNPIITPGTDFVVLDSLIAMITAAAGEEMLKTVKAGGKVTANFSGNPESIVGLEYPAGGRPNTFTSWGGTNDLQLKPEIAAPGGQIFSTWPKGQYALLSGTSMACPYVAGVAALYISAHGGRKVHGDGFAHMLRKRIVASGTALPWSDGAALDYNFSASAAQVGSGLVNAYKVLEYSTFLDFDPIALNDTRYFSRYHDVTVTNEGDETLSYQFSLAPAAGVEAAGNFTLTPTSTDRRLKSRKEMVPIELVPTVYLPKGFTLKPGQSKTVS